jgi:uncharacterized protein (TIGR02145 family)
MQKVLFTIATILLNLSINAQVGVGTNTPNQALDVETNDASKTAIDINNTSTGDAVIQLQINGESKFAVGVDNSDSDKFKISSDSTFGSAPAISIDNTQNVGIATASPISGLDVNTSLGLRVTTITSATTLDNTHNVILCNTGPYIVTLPNATANAGKVYYIKNIDANGDDITIDGNGAQTIDGATTHVLTTNQQAVRLISDGNNWFIITEYIPVEGAIGGLTCGSSIDTGDLFDSQAASGVSSDIPYTGGNGGPYSGEAVASTGVTGLTATLTAGSFASGTGTVTYDISGTPASAGAANFELNVGGQTCVLTWTVSAAIPGNATCSGATISATPCSDVANTTLNDDGTTADGTEYDWTDATTSGAANTTTTRALVDIGGQCWMRYNMNVTPSTFDPSPAWVNSTDVGWSGVYTGGPFTNEGLLYQWSAAMNNSTTERAQGICPTGFHIPSDCEWMYLENTLGVSVVNQQREDWTSQNSVHTKLLSGGSSGFLALKTGFRFTSNGSFANRNAAIYLTCSTVDGSNRVRSIAISNAVQRQYTSQFEKGNGKFVRCLAD